MYTVTLSTSEVSKPAVSSTVCRFLKQFAACSSSVAGIWPVLGSPPMMPEVYMMLPITEAIGIGALCFTLGMSKLRRGMCAFSSRGLEADGLYSRLGSVGGNRAIWQMGEKGCCFGSGSSRYTGR